MVFVNEYVTETDRGKYKLDALWAKYHSGINQIVPRLPAIKVGL